MSVIQSLAMESTICASPTSVASITASSFYSNAISKIKSKMPSKRSCHEIKPQSIFCCFNTQKSVFFKTEYALNQQLKSSQLSSINTTSSICPNSSKCQSESTESVTSPSPQKSKSKMVTLDTVCRKSSSDPPVTPKDALAANGYVKNTQIAPTLQGEVFTASKTRKHSEYLLILGYIRHICGEELQLNIDYNIICDTLWIYYNQDVVIKTAKKSLYYQQATILNGKKCFIQEDIVKEAQLMAMFKRKGAPLTMIKYYDFFGDANNFYLVMEKGGIGLFEFTVKCHQWIQSGKLKIKYWRECVRFIFAKMVRFIAWMHNEAHCCNLDISLENVVMADGLYFDETLGKFENLDIRFIDFGLTEKFECFENGVVDYKCNKFVGKIQYKAPNVLDRRPFMANKADIWSLGVCLCMLGIGVPPFHQANTSDGRYQSLQNGQMLDMLKSWNRLRFITKHQYHLMMSMICIDEKKRYDIDEVMNHPWLKKYFGESTNLRKSARDKVE